MDLHQKNIAWLKDSVLPLWLEKGLDRKNGGFHESLTLEGEVDPMPRRALVQARQIYSMRIACQLNVCNRETAKTAALSGTECLLQTFRGDDGSIVHSVNLIGDPANPTPELYTQAFAIFGLANMFALDPNERWKQAALEIVDYLEEHRRAPGGGFTELQRGVTPYQSNPHMHLFEAAVAWVEVDKDPTWTKLADEVLNLCLTKFIDSNTGLLAEFFNEGWTHHSDNGRFMWEPGHQYEWAWLMGRYQKMTGKDLTEARMKLFSNAEKAERLNGAVFDQMWSDFSVKSRTSRFWPQGERVKAAAQMFHQSKDSKHAASAHEAMTSLMRFFATPKQGLWFDQLNEQGQFKVQSAKASSLYHIIGAIAEHGLVR